MIVSVSKSIVILLIETRLPLSSRETMLEADFFTFNRRDYIQGSLLLLGICILLKTSRCAVSEGNTGR